MKDHSGALWAAAGAAFALAGALSDPSALFPERPAAAGLVALTFDDGPHPAFAPRLLRALRAEDARATFFIVGEKAEENPRWILAMAREGHEVANHSFSHPSFVGLPDVRIAGELRHTRDLIRGLAGQPGTLFRPPGGRYDAGVLRAARDAGFDMALWTVLTKDHEAPPPEVVRERALAGARDGAVVLLHSGVESTVTALPDILKALRERGLRCVTLRELLRERPEAPWHYPARRGPA